ncbi:MAG: hypothetical protein FWF46_06125 [Oscillospiraceae bacterium]|nr:hypothetical protein [Oscillospiraceae bacterium]
MFTEVAFSNVVYEFHNYTIMDYAGQSSSSNPVFTYPDDGLAIIPDNAQMSHIGGLLDSGKYNNSSSNTWQILKNNTPESVSSNVNVGFPEIVVSNLASNTKVTIDEIKVSEYDQSNNFIRDVFDEDFSSDFGYQLYDNGANNTQIQYSTNGGNLSSGAEILQGPTGANATIYRQYLAKYCSVNPNNKYQVSINVKIENPGANTVVYPEILYYSCAGASPFNKSCLQASIQPYVDYSNQKNVPIFMGEYGVTNWCFKEIKTVSDGTLYTEGNLGGEQYMADMLSVINANKLNSSYWAYSGFSTNDWGIYSGFGNLYYATGWKTYENESLENIFMNYFGGTPAISGEISIVPDTTDIVTGLGITVNWPNNIDGLTKQISIDGGNTFTPYTGKVTMTANGTVIARLIDGNNNIIKTASLTVTNIGVTP